jgi:cell division septum initiation protein DivIVA
MAVRNEVDAVEAGDAAAPPPDEDALAPLRRINLSGDIDDLLDRRPLFRRRLRGYDRLQVDNYATWVESELSAVRRQCNHLISRYGACAAELERLRRAAARPHRGPEENRVSERLGEMLRLAAEEAAEITAAGIDEAERIVARAHTEAEARLQKVESIRQAAVAAGEEVRRDRDEATGIIARARKEAAQILGHAAVERERLAAQAAERLAREEHRARREREAAAAAAAERLAAVQAEVDDLRRQRDEARESLHRLTARIGEALEGAAAVAAAAAPASPAAPGPAAQPVPARQPTPAAQPAAAGRREPLVTSVS